MPPSDERSSAWRVIDEVPSGNLGDGARPHDVGVARIDGEQLERVRVDAVEHVA